MIKEKIFFLTQNQLANELLALNDSKKRADWFRIIEVGDRDKAIGNYKAIWIIVNDDDYPSKTKVAIRVYHQYKIPVDFKQPSQHSFVNFLTCLASGRELGKTKIAQNQFIKLWS